MRNKEIGLGKSKGLGIRRKEGRKRKLGRRKRKRKPANDVKTLIFKAYYLLTSE